MYVYLHRIWNKDGIKQGKFKDEYHKLFVNTIYTANQLNLKNAYQLRTKSITPEQFSVLRILRDQNPNPATVGLITERMLDKNSNASRLIEMLRIKGLVARTTCPNDRRSVDVVISRAGLDLLSEIDELEVKWLQGLKQLSEVGARLLNNLLDKVRG